MGFATETVEDLLGLLVSQPDSITPDTSSCHDEIAKRLRMLGFETEKLQFGEKDERVNNLWATYGNPPFLVFCGHTDVVPPGDESLWKYPPFSFTVDKGIIYGRGVADMKTSIAAFLIATRDYLSHKQRLPFKPGLAFLITADEEARAVNGVNKSLQELDKRGELEDVKYCLVGEPTSEAHLGDFIKNGRRGSLSLSLSMQGHQGHAAYIAKEANLLHKTIKLVKLMLDEDWDKDLDKKQQAQPPTSFNIVNINSEDSAENVTAQKVRVFCNWRYTPSLGLGKGLDKLKTKVYDMLQRAGCEESQYTTQWREGAKPYFCPVGKLVNKIKQAINEEAGIKAKVTTSGGTSDGRFFALYNIEVVEFGPCNTKIHCVDESLPLKEVNQLSAIYLRFLKLFFAKLT